MELSELKRRAEIILSSKPPELGSKQHEHEEALKEQFNVRADEIFKAFAHIDAHVDPEQKMTLLEDWGASHDLDINTGRSSLAVHQDGVESIQFMRPAPELTDLGIAEGFEARIRVTIARHLSPGFQLADNPRPGDCAVLTELVQVPIAGNTLDHRYAEWGLEGQKFLEYPRNGSVVFDKEMFPNFHPSKPRDAEVLNAAKVRNTELGIEEVLAGMGQALDWAEEILKASPAPRVK